MTAPRFRSLTSRLFPVPVDDLDTDQLVPARFLKVTDRAGLGAALFADRPELGLDAPAARGAEILVAGVNFGCGSSREHAPWALIARGFRAIVAPSFADIFRGNALKNGLLPVAVPREVQAALLAAHRRDPATTVTVDLEAQVLRLPAELGGAPVDFAVDPFARRCLLDGVDELGYLLARLPRVEAYEQGGGV